MTKQEKEDIKKEFLSRKCKLVIHRGNESMTIKDYQKWDKLTPPCTPVFVTLEKAETLAEGLDLGIMNEENIFTTNYWYEKNHAGFDLSVRNGRRVRH